MPRGEPRLYESIAAQLRADIRDGTYPPGSQLPGYRELQVRFKTGVTTIRNAVGLLQAEGLVRAVPHVGILVREGAGERRRLTRGRTVARHPTRGYVFPAAAHPGEVWVAHGRPRARYTVAPDYIVDLFGLEPGDMVMRRHRVMSPEGEPPFQIADAWISPEGVADAPQAAEPDTGPGGYLDRLEEAGHGPISWVERLTVRMPDREEARLLGISPQLPVYQILTIGTSAKTKRPIEASVRVIPSDRVEIETPLVRE